MRAILLLSSKGRDHFETRDLLKGEPRAAWEQLGHVAVADIEQEVGADLCVREERCLNLGRIEAGDRPYVETDRAQGQNKIRTLERAVATGSVDDERLVTREPSPSVDMGKQFGQQIRKAQIIADDCGHGGGH